MNLSKRLAKLEQTLANLNRRQRSVACICTKAILATSGQATEFETEMNRICPVHGFRRLGTICCYFFSTDDELERQDDAELKRLVDLYDARLVAAEEELVFEDQRKETGRPKT
jgi:hypothetical protein